LLCDTVGDHPQTIQGNQGEFKYYVKKLKGDAHCALLISNDTPDARRGGESAMAMVKDAGVEPDVEMALSSSSPQSAYTPVVQQMKNDGSNYSYLAMSVNSAVQLRQEAALQGLSDPNIVWSCPSSCYDLAAMRDASSAMEDEWVSLTFLPFSETSSNKMLANFVEYTGKDKINSFAVWGWAATIAFQEALKNAVDEHGVKGVTRANLLASLAKLNDFDSGGMIGKTDIGNKILTPCFLLLQWKSGKFGRVYPAKAGSFDCKPSNDGTVKLDLLSG
jgi:ABC-type branched-subunit amino acid transport system substrate-binding protein